MVNNILKVVVLAVGVDIHTYMHYYSYVKLTLSAAIYPPAAPNDFVNVPIRISMWEGLMPKVHNVKLIGVGLHESKQAITLVHTEKVANASTVFTKCTDRVGFIDIQVKLRR
jgi:hypothetical protein